MKHIEQPIPGSEEKSLAITTEYLKLLEALLGMPLSGQEWLMTNRDTVPYATALDKLESSEALELCLNHGLLAQEHIALDSGDMHVVSPGLCRFSNYTQPLTEILIDWNKTTSEMCQPLFALTQLCTDRAHDQAFKTLNERLISGFLLNAQLHSKCTAVTFSGYVLKEGFLVCISDDGEGIFDTIAKCHRDCNSPQDAANLLGLMALPKDGSAGETLVRAIHWPHHIAISANGIVWSKHYQARPKMIASPETMSGTTITYWFDPFAFGTTHKHKLDSIT